jgi:hypothetical protein
MYLYSYTYRYEYTSTSTLHSTEECTRRRNKEGINMNVPKRRYSFMADEDEYSRFLHTICMRNGGIIRKGDISETIAHLIRTYIAGVKIEMQHAQSRKLQQNGPIVAATLRKMLEQILTLLEDEGEIARGEHNQITEKHLRHGLMNVKKIHDHRSIKKWSNLLIEYRILSKAGVHRYMIIPESLDEMLEPIASQNPLDHIPESFLSDQDNKSIQELKNKLKARQQPRQGPQGQTTMMTTATAAAAPTEV